MKSTLKYTTGTPAMVKSSSQLKHRSFITYNAIPNPKLEEKKYKNKYPIRDTQTIC